MKYHIKEENTGIVSISLEGDILGDSNSVELIDQVNEKINNKLIYCLLDLSKVRYINSSGIGLLITLVTKFRAKEGEIVLINPSDQVKKLINITKLDAIFQIVQNEKEALTYLKKA